MDSFDIAQWADAHSQRDDGAKLFPAGQLDVIQKCERAPLLPSPLVALRVLSSPVPSYQLCQQRVACT